MLRWIMFPLMRFGLGVGYRSGSGGGSPASTVYEAGVYEAGVYE